MIYQFCKIQLYANVEYKFQNDVSHLRKIFLLRLICSVLWCAYMSVCGYVSVSMLKCIGDLIQSSM